MRSSILRIGLLALLWGSGFLWIKNAGAGFSPVHWLFAYGEQYVDSGLAGALNATTPLWTLAFGFLLGTEHRFRLTRLTGLLIGFAGTLLVVAPWNDDIHGAFAGVAACLVASAS